MESMEKSVIFYTDYSVTTVIRKQISLRIIIVEDLNLRLIYVSEYIQRFNIKIRYKLNKFNVILDALSRLVSVN